MFLISGLWAKIYNSYNFFKLVDEILDTESNNINIIFVFWIPSHIDCIGVKCRCYEKCKHLSIRILLDSFCQVPCNCRHFSGSLCSCLHKSYRYERLEFLTKEPVICHIACCSKSQNTFVVWFIAWSYEKVFEVLVIRLYHIKKEKYGWERREKWYLSIWFIFEVGQLSLQG